MVNIIPEFLDLRFSDELFLDGKMVRHHPRKSAKSGRKGKPERKKKIEKKNLSTLGVYVEEIVPLLLGGCRPETYSGWRDASELRGWGTIHF